MSEKNHKLALDGFIELISNLANDFSTFSADFSNEVPNKLIYKVASSNESASIERSARKAALHKFQVSNHGIKKFAFDTRRFDQETTRNPRANLQNWNRSEQFINDETQGKIDIFAKLLRPLNELKQTFGAQPEWHNSYVRVLDDAVNRILRVKEADLDIFEPQLAYLEQLMFARYRLSMEELARIKESDFKECIMKKDESLLKRGNYLHMTESSEKKGIVIKDGNQTNDLIKTLFATSRKPDEKSVERTITITIRDSVVE